MKEQEAEGDRFIFGLKEEEENSEEQGNRVWRGRDQNCQPLTVR